MNPSLPALLFSGGDPLAFSPYLRMATNFRICSVMATSVGSLLAGVVGSLWSQFTPATFFVFIAAIACLAALLLKLIDRPARRAMLS